MQARNDGNVLECGSSLPFFFAATLVGLRKGLRRRTGFRMIVCNDPAGYRPRHCHAEKHSRDE
jgi:hypothetical protein